MLDQNGNAGMVDAEKVQAATSSGFKPAVKMVGPDGAAGYVSQDKVDSARQANFAIAPDHPGAQKMVTPDGKITYALPNEVQQFEASGHTLIHPDGRFEVKPLPNTSSGIMGNEEDNTEVMKRASNVSRALGKEQMDRSMQAEQNWWTSKEGLKDEAAGLANVGLAGAETVATLAAGSEAAAAGKAGLNALGETETMQLIKSSPRLYAEWLLKHPNTQQAAIKVATKAAGGALTAVGAGGAYAAYRWLTKLVP
jgi:hypothetical protein